MRGDGKQWVVDLQRSCPEFVGESQVCLYRGNDHINRLIKDNEKAVRRNGILPETVKRKEFREALNQFKNAARNVNFDVESVCDKLRSVLCFPGIVDLCLHRAHLLASNEVRVTGGQDGQEVAEFMFEEQERCYSCILRNFGILIEWPRRGQNEEDGFAMDQQQKKLVEVQMLQRCLNSSNKEFHWRLYQWFQKNRKDLLLKITSPYLLEYLTSNDSPEHMELLKEYYIKHNMFRNAAVLLKELAIKETPDYDLNQRMNFLIRALACAKNCVDAERPGDQMDPYEINQTRDRLELCQIQTDIATAMKRAQLPEEDSQQLEHRLFDIDGLYKNFAMKYKLWESCLQILHFDGSQRSDIIQGIWTNIIRSEIIVDLERYKQQAPLSPRASSLLQPSPWRTRVEKTILRLYQKYQDDPILFPLEHIIRELESNNFNFKHGATDRFVVDCLLQASVNLLKVLEAYETLIGRSIAQTEFTRAMKSRVAQSVNHLQARVKADIASQRLSRSEQLALREAARNLASACMIEMKDADLQDTSEAQLLKEYISQL